MKRRPVTVIRLAPDAAELQRRGLYRRRLAKHVRCSVAQSLAGSDFRPADLARAYIDRWAAVLSAAQDGAGAASALGAAAGRAEPFCPPAPRQALALATFGGKRA